MLHGRKMHHGLRYSLAYAALAVCVTACSSGTTVASAQHAAGDEADPACPATPNSSPSVVDDAGPEPATELQCKKARSEQFKVASIYSPGRSAVTKDGSRIVVGSFSDGWLEVGERTRLPSGWDNDETGGSGFVIKYDVAGNATWVKKFDSQPFARVPFVSTDDGGNIYVAGYVMGPLRVGKQVAPNEEYFDVYVAKLDPHGKLLWTSFGG